MRTPRNANIHAQRIRLGTLALLPAAAVLALAAGAYRGGSAGVALTPCPIHLRNSATKS